MATYNRNQKTLTAGDFHTAATAIAEVLRGTFSDRVWDDSPEDTARRVLKYWEEMAQYTPAGYQEAIPGQVELPFTFTTFPAGKKQMVLVDQIEFASMCAHHMLPIIGVAHVAYIPNQLQVGLSKIPRLVEFWAQRPQMQERLTSQIAEDLYERLHPMGVMVVVEAQHSCMCARGVRTHNGMMRTSLPLGVFLSNASARDEFFSLLKGVSR